MRMLFVIKRKHSAAKLLEMIISRHVVFPLFSPLFLNINLLHILNKKSGHLFLSQCNPQRCNVIHPHPKHFAASYQSQTSMHLSVPLFSQALLMLLAVSLTLFCRLLPKLFVHVFSVCDLFSPHSAGVSLAFVL